MVDWLLGHGADPAVPDSKIVKLPEDWADHDGHRRLSEYLRLTRQWPGGKVPHKHAQSGSVPDNHAQFFGNAVRPLDIERAAFRIVGR
jgi:hypothetical protein